MVFSVGLVACIKNKTRYRRKQKEDEAEELLENASTTLKLVELTKVELEVKDVINS